MRFPERNRRMIAAPTLWFVHCQIVWRFWFMAAVKVLTDDATACEFQSGVGPLLLVSFTRERARQSRRSEIANIQIAG